MPTAQQPEPKPVEVVCNDCSCRFPLRDLTPECPQCRGAWASSPPVSGPVATHPHLRSMWRYGGRLAIGDPESAVSLGEGMTPLLPLRRYGERIGLRNLWFKEERRNPTCTFKDRGASGMISWLTQHGHRELVIASTGNLGVATAAYARRAGVTLHFFLSQCSQAQNERDADLFGARVVRVPGTYDDAKGAARAFARERGIPCESGPFNLPRVMAKKTIFYEVFEQLGGSPHWYVQALSGGIGFLGAWAAIEDLQRANHRLLPPRFLGVQVAGCAPMARAYAAGREDYERIANPNIEIFTLATGNPVAYPRLFRIFRAARGAMAWVEERDAIAEARALVQAEGILVDGATAVGVAGLVKLRREGAVQEDEQIVVVGGGHGYRDPRFTEAVARGSFTGPAALAG